MVVTHVSIKKTEGGYNMIGIEDFVNLPIQERTELLIQKRIHFLNELGENVPLLEGVKCVGVLIKDKLANRNVAV